jgi:formylglycine-generating enzyme required for sulfatase activity
MGEGPLRLITVTEEAGRETSSPGPGRWVNLIHETLIRSKGVDAAGKPQPYWPTLWSYIEKNKKRAARRERLQLLAREWGDREGWARLRGLAGWTSLFGFRGLVAPGSLEHRYLRWSQRRAVVEIILLATISVVIGESVYWAATRGLPPEAVLERWAYLLGKDFPIPELVEIRAGSFMMGSDRKPSEQPVHPVTIAKPFCLGGTEVTFAEWDACVADGKCAGYRPADQDWGRDKQPVIHVSWRDAQIYVEWLSQKKGKNCRLPSEAEWEYAARAGTTTQYALPAPGGSDDIQEKKLANCANCGSQWDNKQTAPVGRFLPNDWGLLDMHGNVNEWVQDCLHKNYTDAPEDERAWENGGDCSSRILRGGSWFDFQVDARSANRGVGGQDFRTNIVGFRVVCPPPCKE